MLGKRGVSEVFIGGLRASPGSDGGPNPKSGDMGVQNTQCLPYTKCGVSKSEGAKDCPFGQSESGGKRNMHRDTGCPKQWSYPVVPLVHAKSVTVVKPPSGPVRSLKTIGCKLKSLHNANGPDLDEYSLAS